MATTTQKKETAGSQALKNNDTASKKNGLYTSGLSGLLQGDNNEAGKDTLNHLFESCLQQMYSAEQQLVEALPEMAKAADSEDLEDALNEHLQQTKKHVERLEKIFNRLEITPGGETCELMEGLVSAAKKVMEEYKAGPVRDSALIIGAQKIEHHEIAMYGSLCELADVLGHHKIMDILDRTLREEENSDRILTQIAEHVNDEACEMAENVYNEK